ncbi:MAG: family 16 glycoside hydrolase, partial [Pseudomonadota bacterium]
MNASLPPENWQTYEITFRAPRWSGQTKTANAKISVIWNGQQTQKDIDVPAPTKLGDAEGPRGRAAAASRSSGLVASERPRLHGPPRP